MAHNIPLKTLYYIPPTDLREPMPNWIPHQYDPKRVRDSLQSVIDSYCVDMGARGRDAYTWSLYAALGLPENVLIYDDAMKQIVEYIVKEAPVDFSCVNRRAWFANSPFLFLSDVRSFVPERHELHMRNDRTIPPREDLYKLHVSVKHEYILYTVLKLSTLHFAEQRPFQMKCLFNSRYSNITDRNTGAFNMRGNGGSVPPIVIYGETDIRTIRTIYQAAQLLFTAEDRAAMGMMPQGDPTRIPPMNVRLDEMFAYALGDRDQKLTRYERNVEPACRLPGWLLAKLGQCDNPAVIGELQGWFGRPVCDRVDAEGRFMSRREDGTVDPLCYLSLSAADMGSPHNMTGGKRNRNRKTRKRKHRRTRMLSGGITFHRNTKPNTNTENYSHLPAKYLSDLCTKKNMCRKQDIYMPNGTKTNKNK